MDIKKYNHNHMAIYQNDVYKIHYFITYSIHLDRLYTLYHQQYINHYSGQVMRYLIDLLLYFNKSLSYRHFFYNIYLLNMITSYNISIPLNPVHHIHNPRSQIHSQ